MSNSSSRATWSVDVLGGWSLRHLGVELSVPHRLQRLVALLLVHGPRPRGYLAGELWPESTDARASANLRTTAVEMRRRAPGLLVSHGDVLALTHDLTSDLWTLRDAFVHGRTGDAADLAASLLSADELLPGWYDDWVLAERDRIRGVTVDLITEDIQRLVGEGNLRLALTLSRAATRLEPTRESSHRTLVMIHLHEGDRVEAWRVYEDFRRRSVREFGVAPSALFEELVQPLRAERATRRVATGARVPDAR